MELQPLFKGSYVEEMRRRVLDESLVDYYKGATFEFDNNKVFFSPRIERPSNLELTPPDGTKFFDAENARRLHRAFVGLTPLEASDVRLWTHLAHTDLYPYMIRRWPAVKDGIAKNATNYILEHWFVGSPSQTNLLRHGLAGLWWAAHLSFDSSRTNPYELTDTLYTQLDLATRTLGAYKLARWKPAILGVLEFIRENEALFEKRFEDKQRFVTKYLNQLGGVKPLAYFDKDYFKTTLDNLKPRIAEFS